MARTVKDVRLESRAARERLEPRKKPYFRAIDTGRHIGYYKGARAGTWLARISANGRYVEAKLGTADDTRDANAIDVLSFSQAQMAARKWFDYLAHAQEAKAAGPLHTVRSAIHEYIGVLDKRGARREGRKVKSGAHRLTLHVLNDAELASTELSKLDVRTLKRWRETLTGAASSRQRITNDFKAALNRVELSATVRLA